MSTTDADLLERILISIANKSSEPLDIFEWGGGRSTVYYTSVLDSLGIPYIWTSLEYDQSFLETILYPALAADSKATVKWICPEWDMPEITRPGEGRGMIRLVCYPRGCLQPFRADRVADRKVDLDDYVNYAAGPDYRYDLMLIDGRMRRRCLIESARLLKDSGVAILHDAHRLYYQCAFTNFLSQRRIGDDLWIGSQHFTSFAEFTDGNISTQHDLRT